MKVLVVTPTYPHAGHPISGIFNERSVYALRKLCDRVEVLAPRPYAPLFLSFVPRWKAYAAAMRHELRNGVPVYRPATPVIPRIGRSLWVDSVAFLFCRQMARRMHRHTQFDAILSFDLLGTGGLAWRLGRDFGIPASGWATGGDVRFPASSSYGKVVIRALKNLDVVFYQSNELLERAAALLGVSADRMSPDRHLVLPRGIPEPPLLPRAKIRNQLRSELKIANEAILVLSVGRISRDKGIFELLEAVSLAAARDPRISCIVVGSLPAFDESMDFQKKLNQTPGLKDRLKLLAVCSSDKVWDYLCAADIFAFTSHHEGMPNSLLEAMAMGVPSIAFAIPPVLEIEAGTGALVKVPPLDSMSFSEAILRLAASPEERVRIGERGKTHIQDRFLVRENTAKALRRLAQAVERHCAPSPSAR
jgi:teichuronic acid biosynthesis glycosyltransferase TuaC